MRFSDLTSSIQDAWLFLLLPMIQCLAVYLIGSYLFPSGTHRAINALAAGILNLGHTLHSTSGVLELFGIKALVPIISVVALVACLYLLRGPIFVLVTSLLPPQIGSYSALFMLQHFPQSECLLVLRKYPAATSFDEAYSMALMGAGELTGDDRFWQDRSGNGMTVQGVAKFSLVAAIIVLWISIRSGMPPAHQFARFATLLLGILIIWSGGFLSALYAMEQLEFVRDKRILRSLGSVANLSVATDDEARALHVNRGARWWRLGFSSYSLSWVRRTLWPRPPRL